MNKRVGFPRGCATAFVHEFLDFLEQRNTRVSPPNQKSRLINFIQHKQSYNIHSLFIYRVLAFSQFPVGTSISVVSQPFSGRCENHAILIDLPHLQKGVDILHIHSPLSQLPEEDCTQSSSRDPFLSRKHHDHKTDESSLAILTRSQFPTLYPKVIYPKYF